MSGLSLGLISNVENVINEDTDDYATLSLNVGVIASASISVRDFGETYPAGYFAGFEISNTSLLGIELLGNSQVRTYLNGVLQETISGNSLVLDVPLLNSSGKQIVGFVTNSPFNEIRYTLNQPLGASLGATNVYNAIIKRYCAGPELQCNTSTYIYSPQQPVEVNPTRTGIFGVACALCSVNNVSNIIDGETDTYANINISAGLGITGAVSIKNYVNKYPIGTFAGFDISNTNILNANFLGTTTIELYNNGDLVQSESGASQILTGNSSLLTSENRYILGIISNVEFDEIRLRVSNVAALTLGTIRVYGLVMERGCSGEFDCLTSGPIIKPDYSVVVESARTGINGGIACVGCSISNPWSLLDSDTSDYATISLTGGLIGSSGSISIRDISRIYPTGTIAGFVVNDPNSVLEVNLLNSIRISTYLDGVLQEQSSNISLLDLNLILPWIGGGSENRAVGFTTTMPFNELRITFTSIASLLSSLRVHNAFVDAQFVDDPSLNCNCTKPSTAGSFLNSSVGIMTKSSLSVNNWPESVPNGSLVLDSSNKGMILTHMTTAQIQELEPLTGMMVYDTDLSCVKLYRGTPTLDPTRSGWVCIRKSCNE